MNNITDDDVAFKSIHPFNIGNVTKNGRCQLIASAFNFIFIASDEGLKVLDSSSYEETSSKTRQLKDKPLTDIDFVFVLPLDGCPCWLSINQDGTTLAVSVQRDGGCFTCIYDTRDLIEGRDNEIVEVRLGDNPVASLVDFSWNPDDPNIFAILLTDGAFRLFQITDKVSIMAALQKSDIHSFCWSPKGKQIVVAKFSGDLVQLDFTFQTKRIISLAEFYKALPAEISDPIISDVVWIATFLFFVNVTSDTAGEDEPALYTSAIVSAPKTGPAVFQVVNNVCCCDEDLLVQLGPPAVSLQLFNSSLLLHQLQWPLLLLGLASTEELSLLFVNPTSPETVRVIDLADNAKAPIPIGSSLTGLTVNFCSNTQPDSPLVLISLDCGQVFSFYVTLKGYKMPNYRTQTDQNYSKSRRVVIGGNSTKTEQRAASTSRTLPSNSSLHPVISSYQSSSISLPSSPRRSAVESSSRAVLSSQRHHDDLVPDLASGNSVSEVIRSALEQFSQELQLSWQENSQCLRSSGDRCLEERPHLTDVLEKTDRFTSAVDELSRVTRDIARETDELKADTINSHCFAERGRLALLQSTEPGTNPQRSFLNRELDPRTMGQLNSLQKQYKTVESLLGDVSTQLDDIFDRLESRKKLADETHYRGHSNRTGGHPARRLHNTSSSYRSYGQSSTRSIASGNVAVSRRASWDASSSQQPAIAEICRTLKCNAELIQMEEYRLADLIDRLHLAANVNPEDGRSSFRSIERQQQQYRPLEVQLRRDHELIQSLGVSPPIHLKSSPGTILKATAANSSDRMRMLERSVNSSVNESGDHRIRAHLKELERTKFSPGRVVSSDVLQTKPNGDSSILSRLNTPSSSTRSQNFNDALRGTPSLSATLLSTPGGSRGNIPAALSGISHNAAAISSNAVYNASPMLSAQQNLSTSFVDKSFPSSGKPALLSTPYQSRTDFSTPTGSLSGGKSSVDTSLSYGIAQPNSNHLYGPSSISSLISQADINGASTLGTGAQSRSALNSLSPSIQPNLASSHFQTSTATTTSSYSQQPSQQPFSNFSGYGQVSQSSFIPTSVPNAYKSDGFSQFSSSSSSINPSSALQSYPNQLQPGNNFNSSGLINTPPSSVMPSSGFLNTTSSSSGFPGSSFLSTPVTATPTSQFSAMSQYSTAANSSASSYNMSANRSVTTAALPTSTTAGLFGSTSVQSNFGQFSASNYSTSSTGGGLFASQPTPSMSSIGSGLLSNQTLTSTSAGGSLFPGQTLTSTSSGGSLFPGQTLTSTSSGGSLFPGQTMTSTSSTGGGLFSSQALTSSSTSMSNGQFSKFGMSNNGSGTLFTSQSTSGNVPGTSLAGGTSGGLFGSATTAPASSFQVASSAAAGTSGLGGNPQQNIGGLFGSALNLGGTSGAQLGSSGSASTSGPFGSGPFGSTSTATPSTTGQGLFGNATSSPFNYGTASTQSSSGIFGATPPSSSSTGHFGSTSLFSNNPPASSSSSLFGTTTSAAPNLFGTSSTTSGGLFSSSGQTSSFGVQQQSGLFGSNAAAPSQGLFGNSTSTTANQNLFSNNTATGFGTSAATQQSSGGLFSGGSSLFAATNQSASGFGAAPAFGSSPVLGNMGTSMPSGIFGASSSAASSTGGLFGSTSGGQPFGPQSNSGTSFGSPANNLGASPFNNPVNSNISFGNLANQSPAQQPAPVLPQSSFGSSPSFTQRRA